MGAILAPARQAGNGGSVPLSEVQGELERELEGEGEGALQAKSTISCARRIFPIMATGYTMAYAT